MGRFAQNVTSKFGDLVAGLWRPFITQITAQLYFFHDSGSCLLARWRDFEIGAVRFVQGY
jgi:hypothetical protein